MNSTVDLAVAALAVRQAQTQMAVAAKFAKLNAASQQSVATLIEASARNMQQASKAVLPAGLGANLDITA
ncbi:MAG: hypothetical protein D6773_13710 [Alphaproteobacteria bacterium]|nr:MAG: hypothetical protein D6773_13710 [Alphaproteobacteria bacterium]